MATDWLLIGSTFMFVVSATSNILGWDFAFSTDWGDYAKSLFFIFLATVSSLECGWLLLGSDNAWMVPLMYFFWGIGLIDFVAWILLGLQGLNIWREKRQYRG